ncbi:hypothetical protein [Amycolatopsis regifaucium]|uniref:Uncharacterized protein n=1 Tax=Amycolatopsis regifaucium TaxID=546365 RepID=A0A154MSF2_9PSEU|nr:hypothetical protein [Amycolatopsis regifaucium]KZB87201.1 hypothetical protein AVL48_21255 [Amycolatopsis regifaucium]OKA08031.1 hypothetical protein ATP06_0212015 [Amycolatopsis regifaucium]SFI37007.1 hypothetical protein SAMN04489731_11063 [Amycolatopsis regifaucium]
MTKETSEKDTEKTEKQGRIVQVLAAAMAAITAAMLGSTLGVAGTVAGAGLASVITTLGGELYLRSLQRTRDAALKAREVLTVPGRRRVLGPDEQETVRLKPPEGDEESSGRKFQPRWAVIAGVSVVAFAVALVAITGFEGATGKTFGGGTGTTIGKIIGGGPAQEQPREKHDTPPSTSPSETRDDQSETPPSTAPSSPATPTTPPSTTTSAPPPTTPSTTQAPPTTPSAPASGTPAP